MKPLTKSCFLGIDVGTTAIKVAVFTAQGESVAQARAQTPTTHLPGGMAEHNADEVWKTIAESIRQVVSVLPENYSIAAVAPATVGEAGVLVGADGQALHPIIAWYDTRAANQAAWWDNEVGAARIYELSGMPLDIYFGANKLLWVRERAPELYKRARWWLSVGDLVVYWLSGSIATDYTLASRTMLFEQHSRTWSQELLGAANLDADKFPHASASGTQIGHVTESAARITGLQAGTPVVLGGHDHLCGAYAVRQGRDLAVDSTGTAEVVVLPTDRYQLPDPDISGYLYHYADVIPERYIYSARIGMTGAMLEWLRKLCSGEMEFSSNAGDDFARLIGEIPQPLQFSGLICYPTFGRVIAPAWHHDERLGAIMGLTVNHTRGQVFQALLEGTGFSLRANLDALEKLVARKIFRLIVEGGATKNPIWMQLRADISRREQKAVQIGDATVLGAAILSAVGVGIYGDHFETAQRFPLQTSIWKPDAERSQMYERVYQQVYIQLPEKIRAINHGIEAVLTSQGFN